MFGWRSPQPALRLWTWALLAATVAQQGGVALAAPTWPSAQDELEDIMFLNTGYRARGFSTDVTPCGFSAEGPGRIAAAEWLRTAFHDMAPGSAFTRVGGLDASIAFELRGTATENIGTAFATTIEHFVPFFSKRSPMSDLIALGVYTAVRSCGGPVVPVRTGRIDATRAGPVGVPQPQNDIGTFVNQFARMGFSASEMIEVTACGHTIGGVHASNFPQIVQAGTAPNDYALFDTTSDTNAGFDERIASEFVSNTAIDPLVGSLATSTGHDADRKVFASDGNVTIRALANPSTFQLRCAAVLQKMIEVVPGTVTLSADPLAPYAVKPSNLQLTLLDGGEQISFDGEIRVRTTTRAESGIESVKLLLKDRSGGTNCGGSCEVVATKKGTANGFDDSFTFYGFSANVPAQTSVSSFTVVVALKAGGTETYDNNGNGYPVTDTVMLLAPQSCLGAAAAGKQTLSVTAAVRNDGTAGDVSLAVTLKVPRTNGVRTPILTTTTNAMTKQSTLGVYDIYTVSTDVDATQTSSGKFDVLFGSASDSFKNIAGLGATCKPLGTTPPSSSAPSSSPAPSTLSTASSTTSSPAEPTSTTASAVVSTPSTTSDPSVVPSSSTVTPSPSTTSTVTNPTSSAYTYQGCYIDSVSARTLTGGATNSDDMTTAKCAAFCSSFPIFGTEYGRECFCGSSSDLPLSPDSKQADSECNMKCVGDSSQSETCGAGNRLSIYANNQYQGSQVAEVTGYEFQGCYNDSAAGRALTDAATTSTTSMTVESCATFCNGAAYFGVEFGSECYCGSSLENDPEQRSNASCSSRCSGSSSTFCGGPNRLSLYKSTTTGADVPDYAYQGCHADDVGARVLGGRSTSSSTMTHAACATFCAGSNFFGVEYGRECYCGATLSHAPAQLPEPECNFPCAGAPATRCGGSSRIGIFASTSPSSPPLGPTNPLVPGWSFKACYTDAPAARALRGRAGYADDMTVAKCAAQCAGSAFFGTEYAGECYCGDEIVATAAGGADSGRVADDQGDCGMACKGDAAEACGGSGRLSLYERA